MFTSPLSSPATNSYTSSTPPTSFDKPKGDKSGFRKLLGRYWMCFGPTKPKQKFADKSTKGHSNEAGHDNSYCAMSPEERDENLKAVISYCNDSKDADCGETEFVLSNIKASLKVAGVYKCKAISRTGNWK
ncbi:hypothetical protein Dsin_015278 [Dipteronia sinensis]|uniref:Uncharacterized protein n=1 Tax=Dipteronia sinensis TaxID=43782 RepID=A0AAE0AC50_9ROSI|nr:hypothetical protein Dsin_015278 [Dipteronia sinensis]